MKHSKFFRSMSFGLALSALTVAPGCDEDDRAAGPQQYVEQGVTLVQANLVLDAAGLSEDVDVADFVVYNHDSDAPEYPKNPDGSLPLLSGECVPDPEAYLETTCGGCVCDTQGQMICVDFQCDGLLDQITAGNTNQGMSPAGPDHDDNRSNLPGKHSIEVEPAGPGADFDTYAGLVMDTDMANQDGANGASSNRDDLTAEPAFCRSGHAVGAIWTEAEYTCMCKAGGETECFVPGDPSSPEI